jgi:hypothetical protein
VARGSHQGGTEQAKAAKHRREDAQEFEGRGLGESSDPSWSALWDGLKDDACGLVSSAIGVSLA